MGGLFTPTFMALRHPAHLGAARVSGPGSRGSACRLTLSVNSQRVFQIIPGGDHLPLVASVAGRTSEDPSD